MNDVDPVISAKDEGEPAPLLKRYASMLLEEPIPGPVLDLACGNCANGVYLAGLGHPVVCLDVSNQALDRARALADRSGARVDLVRSDLELGDSPSLEPCAFGIILVFRYLHRPLFPSIREALRPGGFLLYETFTVHHARFSKPKNPAYLLKPGELRHWFRDWRIIHYFEGLRSDPERAVAELVCRKPAPDGAFDGFTRLP